MVLISEVLALALNQGSFLNFQIWTLSPLCITYCKLMLHLFTFLMPVNLSAVSVNGLWR